MKGFAKETIQILGDPGGCMDAVGNMTDRHRFDGQSRPKMLPHFAGDAAVLTTHTVDMRRQPHDKGRHIESLPAGFGSLSQPEEFVSREIELLPVTGKIAVHEIMREDVVASRYRRMGREHRALAD